MHGWAKVIAEDLGCDPDACRAFHQLMLRYVKPDPAGPERAFGFMEASRSLAHILKDKNMEALEGLHDGQDWSRFMLRACEEAMQALCAGPHVWNLKRRGKGGWEDFDQFPVRGPGAPGAPPPPPCKGKGAYGYGGPDNKGFHPKGYRP